jgi:hypothetical protein
MSGFIGCGTVYFNRVVSGVAQGWTELGNTSKFELTPSNEIKERSSKQCSTYGQTLDSVSINGSTGISFMLDDMDDNLDIALLGLTTSTSVVAGTVTAEVATATLGAAIQTAQRNISSVVVKDQPGTTTYVLGTDYSILNAAAGLVTIITGGSIGAGDSIQLDYSYAASTSQLTTGSTESSVKGAIMLIGDNLAKPGEGVIVNVWDATIAPATGVDFLSDEFVEIEMAGILVTDATKGNAYQVEVKVA